MSVKCCGRPRRRPVLSPSSPPFNRLTRLSGVSCIAKILIAVTGYCTRRRTVIFRMATTTILRNPLTTRSHSQQAATPGPSLQRGRKIASIKRAHSPEPAAETQGAAKRAKAAAPELVASPTQDKKLRRAERDQEFRDKYGRAFPKWIFYFDVETVASAVKDPLIKRVTQMGAVRTTFV